MLRDLKNDDDEEETLYLIAGDRDEEAVNFNRHVECRNFLADKFLADKKNTEVLTKIVNDEEGVSVSYFKIIIHQESD